MWRQEKQYHKSIEGLGHNVENCKKVEHKSQNNQKNVCKIKTVFKNVRDAGKMKSKKSDLSSKKIFEADIANVNS